MKKAGLATSCQPGVSDFQRSAAAQGALVKRVEL